MQKNKEEMHFFAFLKRCFGKQKVNVRMCSCGRLAGARAAWLDMSQVASNHLRKDAKCGLPVLSL